MFRRRAVIEGLPAGVPYPSLLADFKKGRYAAARSVGGEPYDIELGRFQTLIRTSAAWVFNSAGVLEQAAADVPRFQHNPVTKERIGLLFESPVTNLLFPSRNIAGTGWSSAGLVRTGAAATGIDGVANAASTLVEDTAVGIQRPLSRSVDGYVSGTQYVTSVIVKRRGPAARNLCMVLSGAVYGTLGTIVFDLTAKTVASQSGAVNRQAGIEDLGNGWLRTWVSYQAQAAGGAFSRFDVLPALTAYATYTGDGQSGFDVEFWQVETGFRPTSPILTIPAAVLRNRDSGTISLANAPWWNPAGGTMLMSVRGIPPDNQARVIGGIGNPTFDANVLYPVKGTDNSLNVGAGTGGAVFIPLLSAGGYTGQNLRIAMRWTGPSGAVSACLNGGAVVVDSTTAFGNGQTQIRMNGGPWGTLADGNNGVTTMGAYWPFALTDAQMQAVTLTEW